MADQLKGTYLEDDECTPQVPKINLLTTLNLRITKFCDEEFNLAKGVVKTIRLATTDHYRDADPLEETTDETEGTGVLKQNWTSEVNQVRYNQNTYISELPPHYVFCASLDATPKFKATNQDRYFINNVPKFAKLIGNLIAYKLEQVVTPKKLMLLVMGYDVTYGKVAPYHQRDMVKNIQLLRDLTFRKPLSYRSEKEVRLAYFPRTVEDGLQTFFPSGLLNPTLTLDIKPIHAELMKIVSLD